MQSVCVYCGSSPGNQPDYTRAAEELGKALGSSDRRLIYGGASVGLMGTLADSALALGGEVIGVIPRSLVEIEVQHDGLTALEIVTSMHERKARMVDLADGFVAMPGGFGTLDELFETLTWAQLGFHKKPIGILNVSGYFDGLLDFLSTAVRQQLVKQAHVDMLLVADNCQELLAKMSEYTPTHTGKL